MGEIFLANEMMAVEEDSACFVDPIHPNKDYSFTTRELDYDTTLG